MPDNMVQRVSPRPLKTEIRGSNPLRPTNRNDRHYEARGFIRGPFLLGDPLRQGLPLNFPRQKAFVGSLFPV